MKIKAFVSLFAVISASAVLSLSSCKKVKTPQSALEHEQWIESLNDSVRRYQSEQDKINAEIPQLNDKIKGLLEKFSFVKNPKAVEGFYILKPWAGKFPLTQTAVIARITEDERLEVIAALTKGRFNHIRLRAGAEQFESPVVPHDQVFNYYTSEINYVTFPDSVSLDIAGFISRNRDLNINVSYLENAVTGSLSLPQNEIQMITETLELFKLQTELKEKEKTISLYSAKIDGCRKILERDTVTATQ